MWDRVDRNRWRLAVYLIVFWAVSSVWSGVGVWLVGATVWLVGLSAGITDGLSGYSMGVRTALGGGATVSLVYVWWSLVRSERAVLRRLGAVIVPKGVHYETKMMIKDMAIAAGMPVAPAMYSLDSTNVNAFVFHALGRRPVLGVTCGLVTRLTPAEQRAVFANLTARILTRDTMVASAVTALMTPLQAWRDHRMDAMEAEEAMLHAAYERAHDGGGAQARSSQTMGIEILFLLPFGPPLVLLGEIIAATFRRSQLTAAEKADAEGMLLLKDPAAMLGALEKCVRFDNVVVTAGEAYGPLFYCWTGDSTNGDDDPEWRRVARLREVLGVEGQVFDTAPLGRWITPPSPRLEEMTNGG